MAEELIALDTKVLVTPLNIGISSRGTVIGFKKGRDGVTTLYIVQMADGTVGQYTKDEVKVRPV